MRMVDRYLRERLDKNTLGVLKKSGSSFIVKIIAVLITFLVSIFLGRLLGPEGLGIINLANRISSLIVVFCLFGVYQYLIKEISISHDSSNWNLIGRYIKSSLIVNGGLAFIITIIFLLLAFNISNFFFNEPLLTKPLIIVVAVVVPQVATRIFMSALIGYQKIWQSNFLNETLSTIIVALTIIAFVLLNYELSIFSVAIAYAVSRLVVFVVSFVYWKRVSGIKILTNGFTSNLLKSSTPFFLVSLMGFIAINIDSIMIGWLSTSKNVGLYAVGAKIALSTTFLLQVMNSALSPKIASLFNKMKIDELNKMIHKITFYLFLIGIFNLIIFLFFGKFFLSFWGKEFEEAYLILVFLSIGQFIHVSSGPAGFILIMCGFENIHAKISGICLILNVILNYFLIIELGAFGAGIATGITIALESILKIIFAKKKTNILTISRLIGIK